MFISSILEELKIYPKSIKGVHGGDINEAFCITTETQQFFLKVNKASLYPGMFICEASSLAILRAHTPLKVPQVIQTGSNGEYQFLLLEWLDKATTIEYPPYQFGQGVAELHLTSQTCFGFNENNYIGTLPQVNTLTERWCDFYANCRILPLVKMLADNGRFSAADVNSAEKFCRSVENIFPEEKPALLHGDLWKGNYTITADGQIAIFDPATYYGHREMDMAMTRLFGGFADEFYAGYNDLYPLEKGWLKRLPYAQLYPLLVHAVLFGGSYTSQVRSILQVF